MQEEELKNYLTAEMGAQVVAQSSSAQNYGAVNLLSPERRVIYYSTLLERDGEDKI